MSRGGGARALSRRSGLPIGFFHVTGVLVFLWFVSHFYSSETGFTELIGFGDRFEARRLPAVRAIRTHVERRSVGYDGQFYAQTAVDPLLRDPAIDRALDSAPLRARRILFSWTAYALGLGRPAWILQAYALQNVGCWLLLAWLLLRWFPVGSVRASALWFATLFDAGLIWSVRYALLDGPSLLMIVLGVMALEKGYSALAAGVLGVAGLGRETNLLSAAALIEPGRRTIRDWLRQAAYASLVVLPFLVWFDYVHSIYRGLVYTTGTTLDSPLAGFLHQWRATLYVLVSFGFSTASAFDLLALIAVTAQLVVLLMLRAWRTPWGRIGCVYGGLLMVLGRPLLEGTPGAFVRVLLPLAVAVNVSIPREGRWFWPSVAACNLTVVQGLMMVCAPILSDFL